MTTRAYFADGSAVELQPERTAVVSDETDVDTMAAEWLRERPQAGRACRHTQPSGRACGVCWPCLVR